MTAISIEQASQGIDVRPGGTVRMVVRVPAFFVSRRIMARGGTPLVRHQVQLVNPDTGEAVGAPATTDDNGWVAIEAPENRSYDIRILDDDEPDGRPGAVEAGEPDGGPPDEPHLAMVFLGTNGSPLANERWTARGPGDVTVDGTSNAQGRVVEDGIAPGMYEVTVRGRAYKVHTVRRDDFGGGEIVPAKVIVRS